MVTDTIATKARGAADEARDTAREVLHDVRERVGSRVRDIDWSEVLPDVLADVRPAPRRSRHRGRTVMLVLVALGAGALVAWWWRHRQHEDYGPASDAFGAAVTEQRSASDGGREPVATPGA